MTWLQLKLKIIDWLKHRKLKRLNLEHTDFKPSSLTTPTCSIGKMHGGFGWNKPETNVFSILFTMSFRRCISNLLQQNIVVPQYKLSLLLVSCAVYVNLVSFICRVMKMKMITEIHKMVIMTAPLKRIRWNCSAKERQASIFSTWC